MSGIYARKIYDNCYNVEFMKQQVNPCKYRTFEPFGDNTKKCNALNGPRANKARSTGELGNSNISYRTDIESQLQNLDIPDSRCISLRTMREKNERMSKIAKSKTISYTDCNKDQDTVYSRLDIPVNNYRSIYINRFSYPIIDPKEFVYYGYGNSTDQIDNQRFGVNTQLAAKDKINKPNMNPNSKLTK
jgi:hypothetical protein